ncbi:RDD family protein [Acinetobacter sp. MD2]|uniref:RDD family protein n=1 Tax=Acinetobacter sp. MD2 TaxID=2600066 RepID=UPI002D1E8687|nr:RDD family protein [Acinetobacter sp. MD2]MEB3767878.1 RDD family protein [Acinetobacter sp. MD2]
MQIYLARNNQQAGPYTLEQINQMLASQQILLTDLAWHQGMSEWKALGELTQGKNIYQPQGYTASTQNLAQPNFHIEVKQPQLASWARRAAAKLIDFSLWIPFFAVPSFIMDQTTKEKFLELQGQTISAEVQQQVLLLIPPQAWQIMAVYVIIMLALQAFLLAKTGQSLGKRALGLQIIDAQSLGKVGLTRIFLLRSVVFIILNLLFMPFITILDYAFAFGKKRQTLHDLLAKTKVIYRQK